MSKLVTLGSLLGCQCKETDLVTVSGFAQIPQPCGSEVCRLGPCTCKPISVGTWAKMRLVAQQLGEELPWPQCHSFRCNRGIEETPF